MGVLRALRGPANEVLDDMVRAIVEARTTLSRPGPEHLSRFIAKSGGIRLSPEDSRGEVEAILAHLPTPQARARLARPSGAFPIDMAREHAEQARYLPEDPSLRGFLSALDNDVRGQRVYADTPETHDLLASRTEAQRMLDDLGQYGINPSMPVGALHEQLFRMHPLFAKHAGEPLPRRGAPAYERARRSIGPRPEDIPFGLALMAGGGGTGALGALLNSPPKDGTLA